MHILAGKTEAPQGHTAPFKYCMDPWPMGPKYFFSCKYGCLQYVIIQVCLAVVKFVCHLIPNGHLEPNGEPGHYFMEGEWAWGNAYGYVTFIQNFSQLWAMYE